MPGPVLFCDLLAPAPLSFPFFVLVAAKPLPGSKLDRLPFSSHNSRAIGPERTGQFKRAEPLGPNGTQTFINRHPVPSQRHPGHASSAAELCKGKPSRALLTEGLAAEGGPANNTGRITMRYRGLAGSIKRPLKRPPITATVDANSSGSKEPPAPADRVETASEYDPETVTPLFKSRLNQIPDGRVFVTSCAAAGFAREPGEQPRFPAEPGLREAGQYDGRAPACGRHDRP